MAFLSPVVLDGDHEPVGQIKRPLLGVERKVLEDEVELEDGLERGLGADLDELRPRAVRGHPYMTSTNGKVSRTTPNLWTNLWTNIISLKRLKIPKNLDVLY